MTATKIDIQNANIIKNLIFLTVFVIISLLAIFFIISPTIDNFKKTKKEYYQTKQKLEIIINEYRKKMKRLRKIKKINKKVLNAFRIGFNEHNFELFASNYMKVHSIKKIDFTKFRKDFIKTTYTIESTVKTPKDFYDFIDAIKSEKYTLRVYFPNKFIKRDKEINLNLKIEYYKLAY